MDFSFHLDTFSRLQLDVTVNFAVISQLTAIHCQMCAQLPSADDAVRCHSATGDDGLALGPKISDSMLRL